MQDAQLQELLKKLTLKEKIAQMVQLPPTFLNGEGQELGVRAGINVDEETLANIGSTLNLIGAEQSRRVQEEYLKKNPHGIPLLFMADIIYGLRCVYPIPLALGCTFDPELLEELASATAKESVASGAHVTFSPMGDLVRDARWGRCLESTGEDPTMNSRYLRALVTGFQKGIDKKDGEPEGIASCIKHFAAYGAAEAGRDYNTVDMSERTMRQAYLPSYKAGVEAGCEMVMTSFNIVDGIPATGNKWLMKKVLREEWGYDKVLITDYAAIAEMMKHGVAADKKEAARLAIEAGVDIDMCTDCYASSLEELVTEGTVPEQLIDEAVLRILRLKNKLGLFEDPFRGASKEKEASDILTDDMRALSRRAALEAMVLLENKEGLLPLCPEAVKTERKKIALIGPYADMPNMLGMWAIHGDRSAVITLKTAFEEVLTEEQLSVHPGCEVLQDKDYTELPNIREAFRIPAAWSEEKADAEMDAAVKAAAEADIAILALGESTLQSGEAASRTRIDLPGRQLELLTRVRAAAKKVIVILFGGRPMELTAVQPLADALLLAWFPGTEGGHAIADAIFGKAEPTGHLSVSLPRCVGQLPLYYNSFSTGRPYDGHSPEPFLSRYTDCPNTALYPYGYGLSYHSAVYGPTEVSSHFLTKDTSITVSAAVKNTGKRAGTEVVQLYIRDLTGSVVRPVKELKDVQRIHLEPGEERIVSFTITEEMLRFYNKDMNFVSEPGKFTVAIAPDSSCELTAEFELN